jgi:hypothetical protein
MLAASMIREVLEGATTKNTTIFILFAVRT